MIVLFLLIQIMAAPPTYVDLGKSAKDVFTKGYGEHRAEGRAGLFHLHFPTILYALAIETVNFIFTAP